MSESVHDVWKTLTTYCEPSETELRQRLLSHYKEAIAEHLVEYVRWLDIRPLWQSQNTRYFRVNFWKTDAMTGERQIAHSVFLAVDDNMDGLRVREIRS